MKFGLIPIEDSRYYAESLHQVELAEKLGFSSAWLEEHHGTSGHYHPSPLIFLAGYATRTQKITLGTNIAVLPLYHPVRLAEDIAQLDVMSGGRMILGAAIGYRPEEFAAYQTSLEGRGAQFVEMIRLIKRLWTEQTITSTGSRYPLQDFTLEPRPIQQPRPPIWIGGWGELALKRAAWLGDAWLPGPTANMEKLKAAKHTYQAHLLQSGIDPAERTQPLTRDLVIAPTANEAEEIALKFLLPAYRDEYSRWSHPLIGSSDSTAVDRLAELRQDRFIIGDPEGVRAGVQHFITEFGTDHLIFRLHFPHMPVELVTRAVKLLGEEIIPAFA